MEIKGKVHCFFEQSGTFKNEFIKLGIPAEDYDIQNNFGQTDHIVDLFDHIEREYDKTRQDKTRQDKTIFDDITKDDLIVAFFPCIYFTGSTNPCYYRLDNLNYRNLNTQEKFNAMLERAKNRFNFYTILYKMVAVCIFKNIRLVIENPFSSLHYLHNNFLKEPDVIDEDRRIRGDYFKKPTGYWFFGAEPTYGQSFQQPQKVLKVWEAKSAPKAGLCSEERSMISSDYARNFICDFILGKKQDIGQLSFF
jgi:hypothetical protein